MGQALASELFLLLGALPSPFSGFLNGILWGLLGGVVVHCLRLRVGP